MNKNRFSKNAKSIRFKAICATLVLHLAILGAVVYGSGGGSASDLLPDLPDFVKEYFEGDQDGVAPQKDEEKKNRKKKPQA